MFGAPTPSFQEQPKPPAAPAVPQPAPPVAAKPNYMPLIMMGAGFLVVVIILVLFFALRK